MVTLRERMRTVQRRQAPVGAKETVTFIREAKQVTITEAIVNDVSLSITGEEGFPTQVTMTNIYIPQDQTLIAGAAVKPKLNDKIVKANGQVYKPFNPSRDMPAVVPHAGEKFWLIRAKLWKEP